MESDAGRLAMIKGLGGQLVRHEQGEFWAIFDNEYLALLDGAVESRGPALIAVRTSDVHELLKDSWLQVGDESYRVKQQQPDGTGMSVVLLKR
jgi:hypothetical protein